MLLLAIGAVSATTGTTVDVTWDGAGHIDTNFVSGNDATVVFETQGNHVIGEFHGTDYGDNPYGYNVDSTNTKLKANVVDGGWIAYTFSRTDSYSPMYGSAGQESYTYVGTQEGNANFAWNTDSNYASLGNSNYGWQSDNQMTAAGTHYIDHYIKAGTNGAEMQVQAVGSTQISDMCDTASGDSFQFGKGCGCYTNAKVDVSGDGIFDLTAVGDNSIVTDSGISTDGTLSISGTFNNGFHMTNFALSGN